MKIIPIGTKTQFILKATPQIMVNTITTIIIVAIAVQIYPEMNALHGLAVLVTATVINKISSYVLVMIDCKKPNLTWENPVEITKQNNNSIFQHVVAIVQILVVMYLATILSKLNLEITYVILLVLSIEVLIFGIINLYINKLIKKKKLLNKIF
ncbi:MAG: hypothetical protein R3Y54_12165 [Eubacteriales bacterium]